MMLAAPQLGSARSFPLPDNFFPPLAVSDAEARQYLRRAETAVRDALAEYNHYETIGPLRKVGLDWTILGTVDNLTTIRKKDRKVCKTRMFGRISGDFRHFMDFFYAETACELFEWNQYMFGYAVDAAVLRNIDTMASGKNHLYLGVKWTCLQPSALARKRDECFLEYMAYTKDMRGRDVGVRVTLPLDLPQCPALPKELKVKRLRTASVVIVRPSDTLAGATQLFMMCDSDLHDHIGSSKYNKQLMTILRDMSMFSDSKRLSTRGMARRQNWVPARSRKACGICARRFHPARHRTHCRLCGDVFCKKCIVLRDAPDTNSSGTRRTFHAVKTKFCKMCVTKSRESDVSVLMAVPQSAASDAPTASSNPPSSGSQDDGASEQSRISWWSETETGGWKEQTFRFSVTSSNSTAEVGTTGTRSSNGSQQQSVGNGSFLRALEALGSDPIEEDFQEEFVEKRSCSFEVIDTSAMLPASQLESPEDSDVSTDQEFNPAQSRSRFVSTPMPPHIPRGNCRRTASVGTARTAKSRSLSECLKEQEELLRSLVFAASTGFHPNKTMPAQPRRPDVRLYEL